MRFSGLLAAAASASLASAQTGFNYGSTESDGYTPRTQSGYQSIFTTAKNLVGTSGEFTSARLYTCIQAGTDSDITSAIPAAIATGTKLLLGLWASGPIDAEIAALKAAISQYGTEFTSLVIGISVGSEDLYRNSPMGIEAGSTVGADPDTIVSYIGEVRTLISGTGLSGVPVGHVDTWTAWVNGSNEAVVNACDWIGVDAYPYFQTTMSNDISVGAALFEDAISQTESMVGSKPIWITETGWPVSGKTENLGVPSLTNAQNYWDAVGCPRFGKVPIFWYTLEDTDNGTPNPSFGVTSGNPLSTTPLYDLSCSNISVSSSTSGSSTATSTSSGSATKVASGTSSTATANGSGVASSGGALTPSEGPGSGYGSGSNATATATKGSTSGSSSGNSTGLSTTSKPTASSSTSSKTAASTSNAGNILSGSVVGLMGALFAAAAAL